MNQEVLNFEDELENLNSEFEQTRFSRKKSNPIIKKPKIDNEKHKSASDKLLYDANMKINIYLKKSPQFKILQSQSDILSEELKIYKQNGSEENYQKCLELLNSIKNKQKELKNIFKNGDNDKYIDKDSLRKKYNESEIIKKLLENKKQLKNELQMSTTSFILKTIKNFRQQIMLKEKINGEEILDFDDLISDELIKNNSNSILYQEYYDFCGEVADIINWSTQDVIDSTIVNLKEILDEILEGKAIEIKNQIRRIDISIQNEKSKISGSTKITDLIFDIFDFDKDNTNGEMPKELLAVTSIKLVRSIAYNTCLKYNAIKYLDDAVSAGLLGLTVAINSWYDSQRILDSPLNFKGYANIYISGIIQRQLLELMSGGRFSGSSKATAQTLNKQKIDSFVKNNPEFDGIDKDILFDILAVHDDSMVRMENSTSESEFTNSVSGEEGDSADIWANIAQTDEGTEDLIEAKLEYEKMFESIKELLNLFEHKLDKKTGELTLTNNKLFNKYDKKLFLMYFGFAHKIEKNNPEGRKARGDKSPGDFIQEEMSEELVAMYAADGITKTFEQAAISDRISKLLKKLKNAVDLNPNLKSGFEYFYKYWQQNQAALNKLSNSREEVGMKIDREELRNIYSDDDEALATQLSDGTKLADIFEISDSNPLEDEIFGMFNEEI